MHTQSAGFVGADLMALVKEAAALAVTRIFSTIDHTIAAQHSTAAAPALPPLPHQQASSHTTAHTTTAGRGGGEGGGVVMMEGIQGSLTGPAATEQAEQNGGQTVTAGEATAVAAAAAAAAAAMPKLEAATAAAGTDGTASRDVTIRSDVRAHALGLAPIPNGRFGQGPLQVCVSWDVRV